MGHFGSGQRIKNEIWSKEVLTKTHDTLGRYNIIRKRVVTGGTRSGAISIGPKIFQELGIRREEIGGISQYCPCP